MTRLMEPRANFCTWNLPDGRLCGAIPYAVDDAGEPLCWCHYLPADSVERRWEHYRDSIPVPEPELLGST